MIHTQRPVLVTAVITAVLSGFTALDWVASAHRHSAAELEPPTISIVRSAPERAMPRTPPSLVSLRSRR